MEGWNDTSGFLIKALRNDNDGFPIKELGNDR
jgi:hypothetical protein